MGDSLDKILATVERISFTLIAIYVALYLINLSLTVSPQGYSQTLLGGLTVIFALGGLFLLFIVVANFLNSVLIKRKK